jgi:hypothetical protein
MPDRLALIIYSRPGCHLCEQMKALVTRLVDTGLRPADITEINVETDPDLEQQFGLEVPVLMVNGRKAAKYRVTEEELRKVLAARSERAG